MSLQKSIGAAVRLYESFREEQPRKVGSVRVNMPKAVAVMGYVEGIDYRTTHGRKLTLYHHDFEAGSRPLLAVSSDGKQLLLLGGRYQFTEQGIVDKDARGKLITNPHHGKNINPRFTVSKLPDGGYLKVARARRSTGKIQWSIARFDAAGKKMGRAEFFPSEAAARRIAGEVVEGLEAGARPRGKLEKFLGTRRKKNPVLTQEQDAALIRYVINREAKAINAGENPLDVIAKRSTTEREAFARHAGRIVKLKK